jgi:arylsulfatase A-like enzyme
MAGGGVKGGLSFGSTDNFGMRALENRVHVHDLHATVLHLMGLDHEKLTYFHQGREMRLTDVEGEVIRALVG